MPREDGALFPPPLGLAVAVVSVSFAAILFRLAQAPALTASFWRLAFAVLLLLPFTRGAWRVWHRYTGRDWLITVVSGVALGAHFALWVTSLFLTTVAASVALVTMQAIFVALGSHFILREPLSARGWLGVTAAWLGAMAIGASDGLTAPDSGRALLGDLLALLGGVGSAIYMLVGRRLRRKRDLVEYVTPVYAVAALTVLVALPFVGQPLGVDIGAASGGSDGDGQGLPLRSFVFFVLLAAVPMLGGHTLVNWCMRYMEAPTVATWILLEPVGAALLAWPILGEVPGWGVVVGGALILAGAWQTVRPQAAELKAQATVPPV